MSLPAYATFEQFVEASTTVISRLRGDTTIERNHLVHCCYTVAGFGLNMTLPCTDEAMAGPAIVCANPNDLAGCLEMVANAGPGYKSLNLDWRSMVSILLAFLQQLLNS